MKLKNIFLPLASILSISGCGTEVGNPGDKPVMTDEQNSDTNQDGVSGSVSGPITVPYSESVVNVWTFDPQKVEACQFEKTIEESESQLKIKLLKSESVKYDDTKFYFYNSSSQLVEKQEINPSLHGVYDVYAISYESKKVCLVSVDISENELSQKQTWTITLKDF